MSQKRRPRLYRGRHRVRPEGWRRQAMIVIMAKVAGSVLVEALKWVWPHLS